MSDRWECPKHGLVYGNCASCRFEREEKDQQDYIAKLRQRAETAGAGVHQRRTRDRRCSVREAAR